MNRFEQLLREVKSTGRIVVLDGAMGTQLQEAGLPPGLAPEKWNLEQPEVVRDIHRAYIEAGADAVETNSFGANRIKLAEYGLEDRVHELNYRAVTLAREAVGSRGFVVGSVGPLGSLMEPLGDVSFDEAYRWFAEQVQALARAGVDALSIETMGDLAELRVAVCAAVNETEVPVLAHMTYTGEGRTYTGTPPEAAAAVLESLGQPLWVQTAVWARANSIQ
jgi:5-methyltetrahydrofolate--homocysteine methyltransferase